MKIPKTEPNLFQRQTLSQPTLSRTEFAHGVMMVMSIVSDEPSMMMMMMMMMMIMMMMMMVMMTMTMMIKTFEINACGCELLAGH